MTKKIAVLTYPVKHKKTYDVLRYCLNLNQIKHYE